MRHLALGVVLVLGLACSQSVTNQEADPHSFSGNIGAAAYRIEVPARWNGTLFLYSHGYVAPGGSNPAQASPGEGAQTWLLGHHYAIAGSSYSSTGWAVEDAFKDQMALLDFFGSHVAKPKRVIAWGVSLGGIITAGLVQLHPDRFAAAMPLCGVLAGGIATWNSELDAAYAFRTLLAPQSALQLVNITDGAANLQLARKIFNNAATAPQGIARLALVGALIDLPTWFNPRLPEPAPTDFASRAQAIGQWESLVDFAFAFNARMELEHRAGGNPSWNVGVDYNQLLAASPDRDEVTALYANAGLDVASDLNALNGGTRIKGDPAAAAYLDRNISFDGRLTLPVLAMHTTGDGLVIPPNETAYAQVVGKAGKQDMLRQVFVHRAGHCTFTSAEVIAALQVLLGRLDTGRWDNATLQPQGLNAAALAQGEAANAGFGFSAAPSFIAYEPGPYPRAFAKGSEVPH
jgi:pimeloyl-ACP methyl ester carboxylesterase